MFIFDRPFAAVFAALLTTGTLVIIDSIFRMSGVG